MSVGPSKGRRVGVRPTDLWHRRGLCLPIIGVAVLLMLAGCSEGDEAADSAGTTSQSGDTIGSTTVPDEAAPADPASVSTTVASVSTTVISGSTTVAAESTTVASVSTTVASASTTVAAGSSTVASVSTTVASATTTVEPVTTTVPPVAWPTVFNAWIGGGDPGADCGSAWDFRGFQPVGPFIGSAWESDEWWIGRDVQLCLAGFDFAQAIELVVSRPDGSVGTVIAHSGDEANIGVSELIAPGVELDVTLATNFGFIGTTVDYLDPALDRGSYSILASQGDLTALVEFEIVVGELGQPYINPLDGFDSPATLEPGDLATVLLLGFAPETAVPLAVYRNIGGFDNGEEDFEFLQLLATAPTNAEGWAFVTLDIPDLEPLSTGKGTSTSFGPQYCIVTTPDLIDFDCQPGFTPGFNQP